jgi:hypothetical protein
MDPEAIAVQMKLLRQSNELRLSAAVDQLADNKRDMNGALL